MANITRIKAKDTRKKHDLADIEEAEVVTKVKTEATDKKTKKQPAADQKTEKTPADKKSRAKQSDKKQDKKSSKKADKKAGAKRESRLPKPLRVILTPFTAFGRYVRNSWGELRQVRWPSRKATWKLTLAVLIYCALFIVIIMVLDLLFTELFGWILG